MSDTTAGSPAPGPERPMDVVKIDVGLATAEGSFTGLAFRFHLRDGSTALFALPEAGASQLAALIQERLAAMKKQRSPQQGQS
jgi:hypothetical protein